MADPNDDELLKATAPARGPTFPFAAGLFSTIQNAISAHPDKNTDWHEQMVRRANQSFKDAAPDGMGKAGSTATNQNQQSAGKRMMRKPKPQQ